jgi:hypothetical protein
VKQITFKTVLTIASQKKMKVKHVDIKTAFLFGQLEEEVFMEQPPGFYCEEKSKVCRTVTVGTFHTNGWTNFFSVQISTFCGQNNVFYDSVRPQTIFW